MLASAMDSSISRVDSIHNDCRCVNCMRYEVRINKVTEISRGRELEKALKNEGLVRPYLRQ